MRKRRAERSEARCLLRGRAEKDARSMDFSLPERVKDLLPQLRTFVREKLYPLEAKAGNSFRAIEPDLAKLRAEVKERGWWAPQLSKSLGGMGLSNLEHGLVSEVLGSS